MSKFRNSDLLANRYRISHLLGKGTFSEVYHAVDTLKIDEEIDKEVAIKVFLPTSTSVADLTELADKCLAIGQLGHRSVVKVISLHQEANASFLVQELLRGDTLCQLMNKKSNFGDGSLDLEEIIDIGIAVANALDLAHEKNIFHGDIKPSNICFRDESNKDPVLVDFGDNTFKSAHQKHNNVDGFQFEMATLQYISPERVGYLKSDNFGAMDLYSLGVILYELSTGELPIKGDNPQDFVGQLYSIIPNPVHTKVPGFPRFLDDIILKLLRKSPKERYQTPSGLIMDLKTALKYLKNDTPKKISALGRYDTLRELNYGIPLVGRKKELRILCETINKTHAGESSPIMISAPSGTGKSRLSSEVMAIARSKNMKISESKFSRFERNVPLSALNRALREHCEWLQQRPDKELSKWRDLLVTKLGERGSLLTKRLPHYSKVFPDFPTFKEVPGKEEERIFLETFAEFLTMMDPDEDGRVIFLDDLQWADKTSIDVLQYICWHAQKLGGLNKTLLLGAFRSEEVPPSHPLKKQVLDFIPPEHQIRLENLDETETSELVDLLLDESSEEIEHLKTYAFHLTNGSPFFIYELLKATLSNGIFYLSEKGHWTFNHDLSKTKDIIPGVDKLVTERIHGLSKASFELIRIAATTGSSIKIQHLIELIEELNKTTKCRRDGEENEWIPLGGKTPEVVVRIVMDELRRNHLIADETKVLTFFHDKIRDAALGLIEAADKKIIHLYYGRILSQIFVSQDNMHESKDIFEAAFHVTKGDPKKFSHISKQILILAGKKATEIFAYKKAREYLEKAASLVPETPDMIAEKPEDLAEWQMIQELYADALALSEDLHGAISIYHKILQWEKGPYKRATIFSKLASNNLYLFRYAESIEAGVKGLEELNEPYMKHQISSLFYITFRLPLYLIQLFFNNRFGKRDKEIIGEAEKIKWDLRVALEVPFFFTRPLAAVANQLNNAIVMLDYKDNYYKSMTNAYWGAVCATVGMRKTSDKCFNKALDYFNVNHNPVSIIFINFVKASLLNFPIGKVDLAQEQFENAVRIATEIGETFWRFLGYMGLIHLDYYGKGTGMAPTMVQNLLKFYKKIDFMPTINGCTLRTFLNGNQRDEYEKWSKAAIETGEQVAKTGYVSIDVIYSYIQPGEGLLLQDKPEKAIQHLRKAFLATLLYNHRVNFCFFAAPLLALAYVRSRKKIKAIIPLTVGWINSLLSVRICQPQLLMATAEWVYSIGFKNRAVKMMDYAIDWTARQGWEPVIAELRMSLAKMVLETHPDLAQSHLKKAEETFQKRHSTFLKEKCLAIAARAENNLRRLYPELYRKQFDKKSTASIDSDYIRKQIDNTALLEMFRKLSVLSDLDTLLQTVLETLCTCTGAVHGVAFLPSYDNVWTAHAAKGVDLERVLEGDYYGAGIDKEFFDLAISTDINQPKVRNSNLRRVVGNMETGAVLILPLKYNETVTGLLYLANDQIPELFDDLSLDLVGQIAIQAAIAINNFNLSNEVANRRVKQASLDKDLEAAKAVQEALLPHQEEDIPGVDIASHYQSADQTGGDWFTFHHDKNTNRLYLFVGDVTGHGVPSALITGVACGAIKAFLNTAMQMEDTKPEHLLEEMATIASQIIGQVGEKSQRSMTMAFVSIDLCDGTLTYLNAGHPFLVHVSKDSVQRIAVNGPFLGAKDYSFSTKTIKLTPGEKILIYSDGLTENVGPDGKEFKTSRLLKLLKETTGTPEEVKTSILSHANTIWQSHPPIDDCTLLVVEWNGNTAENSLVA